MCVCVCVRVRAATAMCQLACSQEPAAPAIPNSKRMRSKGQADWALQTPATKKAKVSECSMPVICIYIRVCSSNLPQVVPAKDSAESQVCPFDDENTGKEAKQETSLVKRGGRASGPGKPLMLSKQGKANRKGKSGVITVWQKMEIIKKYEELLAKGEVCPEKIMLQKKMFKHQFQGCLAESKWMGARKAQNWDAMVLYAPKMAKKMREVPNVLREVLGMDKKKYSRSKFPQASKLRNLPTALMLAAEDLLIQRMELGEVVNYQYLSGIVDLLSETWNQKVAELKEEVRRLTAPSILEAEDAVWDEAEDPQAHTAAERMAQACSQ